MLVMILAAMTAAAPQPATQQKISTQYEVQQKTAAPCAARRAMARNDLVSPFGWSDAAKAQARLVSKIVEPDKGAPQHDLLPRDTPSPKGPAILQPGCKTPEGEENMRYPMV